jgi:hypothetical protein
MLPSTAVQAIVRGAFPGPSRRRVIHHIGDIDMNRNRRTTATIATSAAFAMLAAAPALGSTLTWSGTNLGGWYPGGADNGTSTVGNIQKGVTFLPNSAGVKISGTFDISGMASGAALGFGLVDANLADTGGSVWQSGAYIYIAKLANSTINIGTSDGNLGGSLTTAQTNIGSVGVIDFTLIIQQGSMTLTSSLFTGEVSGSYGSIKTLNNASNTWASGTQTYNYDEFAFGAYVHGWLWPNNTDPLSSGYNTLSWNLTATAIPGSGLAAIGTLGLAGVARRRRR